MKLNRFTLLAIAICAIMALPLTVCADSSADSLRAVLSVPVIEFKAVPEYNQVQTDSLVRLGKEANDWRRAAADHAQANRLFLKAAENGSMEGLRQLAQNTINGLGTEADVEAGLRMLMQGVGAGDVESMLALGDCLNPNHSGRAGLEGFQNTELAAWAFRLAGSKGNAEGYAEAAAMFNHINRFASTEAEKALSEIKCISYAELGQAMGSGECSEILAGFYQRNGGKTQDEINSLLIDAAEKGDPSAMLTLAYRYAKGENGFREDKDQARRWFIKWQSTTIPDPMFMYEALSEGNYGLAKDKRAAADWLIAGVENGNNLGNLYCRQLAEIYRQGSHGLPRDPAKAQYYEDLAKNWPTQPSQLLYGVDFCGQSNSLR